MERDLFRIINGTDPVIVGGAELRPECRQCLKRWLDDLMLGIYRPLPCSLTVEAILAYIREYIFPPPTCAYPLTAVFVALAA